MDDNQNINFLKDFTDQGLKYLVQCSNIPEEGGELFKICLDFWYFFTMDILQKTKKNIFSGITPNPIPGMNLDTSQSLLQNSFMHGQIYPKILEELRETMIDKMAKPKEVLVVIDDNGEAVEEHFQDTETIHLYEQMREILVFLTNIDSKAMDRCTQRRLDKITSDKSYFSFDRLNKLCWALGSISGCMSIDDENRFVVAVVKELLNLCEKT